MKLLTIIFSFLILLSAGAASGASAVLIGGYDVARIASSTVDVLEKKQLIGREDAAGLSALLDSGSASDPLVAAQTIAMFYDKLGAFLVGKDILAAADIESAKNQASQSGGVKAGGLNPVVLAASYLDAMSKRGVVSVSGAQTILDVAKIK